MRQEENSLKSNIIYQILYQILALIVPLITSPYIARILGSAGLGTYSYTYAIANYFVMFAMLGIMNYGNREVALAKTDIQKCSQLFWNVFFIHILNGLLSLLIYIAVVVVFFKDYRAIAMVQALFIVSAVFDISWLYFGLEKFKMTTIVSCINKVLTTVLIFLLIKEPKDVLLYAGIIAGGTLFNNVIYWAFLKKQIVFCTPNFKDSIKHIRPLVVLFIPVIAVSVYKYMDKIMLGIMMTTTDVGIYEAAEKFINLPMCVISALGTVMLPRITNLKAKNDIKTVQQYNYISMMFVMFVSCGMSFGLAGISDVFIPWFYGTEFQASSKILLILLPSIVFVSWANVIRTQCLLPAGNDKLYCMSVILGAAVNLCANVLLIPNCGIAGAAIGTTIAEFFVCLVQTIAARREMNFKTYFKDSAIYVLVGFLMMVIISRVNLKSVVVTIVTRIIVGGLIYACLSSPFLKRSVKNLGIKDRNQR